MTRRALVSLKSLGKGETFKVGAKEFGEKWEVAVPYSVGYGVGVVKRLKPREVEGRRCPTYWSEMIWVERI